MFSIKQWVKLNFSSFLYRRLSSAKKKKKLLEWAKHCNEQQLKKLSDASYDIFTYHGEDGIILYLLEKLKNVPTVFVDIGSGDCIKSNCAVLATHFKWRGVFIDKNDQQIAIGRRFYISKPFAARNIVFLERLVTRDNVNQLLLESGLNDEVGLLSIDIDGNDYWIWKAIECIKPRIVVIEAKVEFGFRNIVVGYGEKNHHSVDKLYNGASVEALRLLGRRKGYKLVGGNIYGYNLFFVKQEEEIPEVTTADILVHPETKESFYPNVFFETHSFITEKEE